MPEFRTIVEPDAHSVKLGYHTHALFAGSCFTQSVGGYLEELKFPVRINPFGTLYNPVSVARLLERLLEGNPFRKEELTHAGDTWFSFLHSTAFSGTDAGAVLKRINQNFTESISFIQNLKFLFLTFGTSRVYEWNEDGRIVANCHKLPAKQFRHRLLDVDEIVARYSILLENWYARYPDLQVVFTVSPVRHWKDGPYGNQVSKSVLFVAIEALLDLFHNAIYFPAYELMMDDLRDYRFYAEDMLHPGRVAIEYIREKFRKTFVDPEALPVMQSLEKVRKAMLHKPLDRDSREYKTFAARQLQIVQGLQEKYNFLDLSGEIKFWNRNR